MINKIKLILATAAAVLMPAAFMAAPVYAQQTVLEGNVCSGAELEFRSTGQAAGTNTCAAQDTTVNNLVKTVINIFTWVVGVISVIMIIVGGFKYITSGGESGGVTSAKNTIMYAIIGLIVVALAQVIVRFVLNNTANISQ